MVIVQTEVGVWIKLGGISLYTINITNMMMSVVMLMTPKEGWRSRFIREKGKKMLPTGFEGDR